VFAHRRDALAATDRSMLRHVGTEVMPMHSTILALALGACFSILGERALAQQITPAPEPAPEAFTPEVVRPEVPYVPTPDHLVRGMLELANVTEDDVVYDLGCGDGRIVIAAARDFGARAVGVDIDPERIKESEANAVAAGVSEKVKFLQQDLFDTDLGEATVVTLYLLPSVNKRLRPKLQKELRPGARIVSHSFSMGDWEPVRTERIGTRTLYYWIVGRDAPEIAPDVAPEPIEAGAEKQARAD
jgi:SAM-dependent methyltransferase